MATAVVTASAPAEEEREAMAGVARGAGGAAAAAAAAEGMEAGAAEEGAEAGAAAMAAVAAMEVVVGKVAVEGMEGYVAAMVARVAGAGMEVGGAGCTTTPRSLPASKKKRGQLATRARPARLQAWPLHRGCAPGGCRGLHQDAAVFSPRDPGGAVRVKLGPCDGEALKGIWQVTALERLRPAPIHLLAPLGVGVFHKEGVGGGGVQAPLPRVQGKGDVGGGAVGGQVHGKAR